MPRTREYLFNVAVQTPDLPTVGTPTNDNDTISKGFADLTYARRLDYAWRAATVADVKAIGASLRASGTVIFVFSLSKLFYFDAASVAAGDDTTVIQPTVGTGRWLQMPATTTANEWNAIVANPAIAGYSTHTTIASAISALSDGQTLLITKGTYAENITLSKRLHIQFVGGYDAYVNGTWTFASGSSNTVMQGGHRIGDNVTINSGVTGIQHLDFYLASGKTYTTENRTSMRVKGYGL